LTIINEKLYIDVRFTVLKDKGSKVSVPFLWIMLKDEIRKSELFIDLSSVLEPMGIKIVAVNASELNGTVNVSLAIMKNEGNVNVDDCADVYHIVYPRLSIRYESRDLNLEVTTPGIQRVFKDYYEFELFAGQRCRIYDSGRKATFTGVIDSSSNGAVVLSDWKNEDSAETGDKLQISFADVYKAKLDYKWEDVK